MEGIGERKGRLGHGLGRAVRSGDFFSLRGEGWGDYVWQGERTKKVAVRPRKELRKQNALSFPKFGRAFSLNAIPRAAYFVD